MGDRAYGQVFCRAKDVAAFEDWVWETEGAPEGVSFLVDEEANYGNSSSLRELAEREYVFIGPTMKANRPQAESGFTMRDEAPEHRSQARYWPLRFFKESQSAEAANETVRGLAMPP